MRVTVPRALRTLLSLALLVGCGGGDTESGDQASQSEQHPRIFGEALAAHLAGGGERRGTLQLADGLSVEVEELGRGPAALRGDELTVDLVIKTVDGQVIENTRGEPRTIPLDESSIIRGLCRALEGMPAGTRARVNVPADLGFGDRTSPGSVPANTDLVVDVHLWRAR
jgi:FKBP-type peptidyl-prolyl cis-trans isomerase